MLFSHRHRKAISYSSRQASTWPRSAQGNGVCALPPDARPSVAVGRWRTPLASDGVQPATGLVYYPGQATSMAFSMQEQYDFKEGRWRIGAQLDPPSPPDPKAPPMAGFFVAWDPVGRRGAMAHSVSAERRRAFDRGTADRRRQQRRCAARARSGDRGTLWQHQMLPGVATPITYKFDGR